MNKTQICIIDDDNAMAALLSDYLGSQGHQTRTFSLASTALQSVEQLKDVDLIISDINMPELNGMDFVKKIKKKIPHVPVILITAFGSIEQAIEAIRIGAFDYIVKPFKLNEVDVVVQRALRFKNLQKDNDTLRAEVKNRWKLNNVLGKSPAMQSVFELVERVSQADATVLITGESGTGKEVIARAVHQTGKRSKKPFLAINCTAIPEQLLESELFGHARGAFTGANTAKVGMFEEAQGGTLFLDEIGDMDMALQAKLLRVIQERKIRRVGENNYRDIDIRIIAATHKDLKQAIREGLFREDLYYRLSVIPIALPPLRHRKEDIVLLAEHFLQKYSALNGRTFTGFSAPAKERLMNEKWVGNVRELENAVERATVLARSNQIEAEDLPASSDQTPEDFFAASTNDFPSLEQLEKRYIKMVLDKTGQQKNKAAQILGINRRTLYRKEKEYGFVDQNAVEDL